jgi:hypothetical protein
MVKKQENIYEILKTEKGRLEKVFFTQSFEKNQLIRYCVDKSTIRSFHREKAVKTYKPLSLFQFWANDYLSNNKNIERINSRKDFAKLKQSTLLSLMRFWEKEDKGKPEFYQFNKLIDLFFKFLPLYSDLNIHTKKWIFNNAAVPLDKFSLSKLREYNSALGIKKNVSMNFIKDEIIYKKIQKEIKLICKDIPVIIFDLYAWETGHFEDKELVFQLKLLEEKEI